MNILKDLTQLAVVKSIRAFTFVFQPRKREDRVLVGRATGWARHRLIIDHSAICSFHFSDSLSNGKAGVSVLNANKEPIAELDQNHPDAAVFLESEQKYYLRWNFEKASGQCELHW